MFFLLKKLFGNVNRGIRSESVNRIRTPYILSVVYLSSRGKFKNTTLANMSIECVPKSICLSCLLDVVEDRLISHTSMLTHDANPKLANLDLTRGD